MVEIIDVLVRVGVKSEDDVVTESVLLMGGTER
jgi:hypothetical protein